MLSLRAHNIIDYVAAFLLLFVPAIFGFAEIDAARDIYLIAGLLLFGYSLLTNYQYSAKRVIPLGVHMTFDCALGLALIVAPWALGYRNLLTGDQELAHYVLGVALFGFVAVTRSKTEAEKRALEPRLTNPFSAPGHS